LAALAQFGFAPAAAVGVQLGTSQGFTDCTWICVFNPEALNASAVAVAVTVFEAARHILAKNVGNCVRSIVTVIRGLPAWLKSHAIVLTAAACPLTVF
jgi:hypothetical protein